MGLYLSSDMFHWRELLLFYGNHFLIIHAKVDANLYNIASIITGLFHHDRERQVGFVNLQMHFGKCTSRQVLRVYAITPYC